jgi:hypothetical protein
MEFLSDDHASLSDRRNIVRSEVNNDQSFADPHC